MRCDRCGEIMRPETIIRLRRRFGFIHARHEAGEWCMACGHTVAHAGPAQPPARPVLAALSAWARLPAKSPRRLQRRTWAVVPDSARHRPLSIALFASPRDSGAL